MSSIIKISERHGSTVETINSIFLNGLHALLTLSSHHKAPRGYLYYIRHRDRIFKRRKCHIRRNRNTPSTIKFSRALLKGEIPTIVAKKPEFVLPSEPRFLIDKRVGSIALIGQSKTLNIVEE